MLVFMGYQGGLLHPVGGVLRRLGMHRAIWGYCRNIAEIVLHYRGDSVAFSR